LDYGFNVGFMMFEFDGVLRDCNGTGSLLLLLFFAGFG